MSYKGLDPIYRLLSSKGISLDEVEGLHPIFKISGLAISEGPVLDYGVKLNPIDTPDAVILVGCGGTGSHVLPNILQYLKSLELKSKAFKMPDFILIDGDEVENKNLVRQRFTSVDVGKKKADALARRYSSVFGCRIASYSNYIGHSDQLYNLASNYNYPMFIGAVDNHRARLMIWDTCERFPHTKQVIWIDGGNETHHGQVILSTWNLKTELLAEKWNMAGLGDSIQSIDLPNFFYHFPEEIMLIGGTPPTPANQCALNVAENPQTIHANATSAQAISNLLTQVFERDIRTFMISFDSLTGGTKAEILTRIKISNFMSAADESIKKITKFFTSLPGGAISFYKKELPGLSSLMSSV